MLCCLRPLLHACSVDATGCTCARYCSNLHRKLDRFASDAAIRPQKQPLTVHSALAKVYVVYCSRTSATACNALIQSDWKCPTSRLATCTGFMVIRGLFDSAVKSGTMLTELGISSGMCIQAMSVLMHGLLKSHCINWCLEFARP